MTEKMDADDDLLRRTPSEPEAFGAFYRRHEAAVLGYFMKRTADPELDGPIRSDRPYISTTTRPGDRQEILFLFRDGVGDVELMLRDGRRLTPAVVDNAVLLAVKPGTSRARWTDEHGVEHRRSFHDDPADRSD